MIDLGHQAKILAGGYQNIVLSACNDHVVRMSRMEQAYPWHFHPNSDEVFLGVEGVVILELLDRQIELGPGQMFTVPKGTHHQTRPAGASSVNLTFERADMQTVCVDSLT